MSNVQVLDVMYQALQLMMRLSLPFLIISMAVGVLVAIFQAATQINEQTLTFVPKIIGILLAVLIFGGLMLNNLTEFTDRIYGYIVTVA